MAEGPSTRTGPRTEREFHPFYRPEKWSQCTGRARGWIKDGSGGQQDAGRGLEGDTSLLLPRRAKAQGREDATFRPPCARPRTRETGNAVTSGKAPLS